MPDYSKGKIYKITSPSHPGECYIGSTVQTLKNRRYRHVANCKHNQSCSSKLLMCYKDAVIELIELYPCASKTELERREGIIIKEHMTNDEMDDTVNVFIAGRTYTEWYRDNKIEIYRKHNIYHHSHKEVRRNWYEKNRPEILRKLKIYRDTHKEEDRLKAKVKASCEFCDLILCKRLMKRHQRTKKCQAFQEQKSKNLGSVAWSSSVPPSLTPGTS